jgi:hypothetical protein
MFCVTPAHYLLFVLASIAIVINPILLPSDDPTQFRYVTFAMVLLLQGVPAYFFCRKGFPM